MRCEHQLAATHNQQVQIHLSFLTWQIMLRIRAHNRQSFTYAMTQVSKTSAGGMYGLSCLQIWTAVHSVLMSCMQLSGVCVSGGRGGPGGGGGGLLRLSQMKYNEACVLGSFDKLPGCKGSQILPQSLTAAAGSKTACSRCAPVSMLETVIFEPSCIFPLSRNSVLRMCTMPTVFWFDAQSFEKPYLYTNPFVALAG